MCSKFVLVFALCALVDYSLASVIREKVHKKEDYSAYFKTLTAYRNRLQLEGLYPKSKIGNHPINAQHFDELEVLQLIPVTIKQLRQHELSIQELLALQKVFGSFWDLIEEDAHRKRSEPRSELLSDLLSSREVRFGKQEIREHLKNDVKGNSVQMVYNTDASRTIKFADDSSTSPSQRILRMIAAICQQVYKNRPAQKSRNKRSDSINLENVKVTIKVPRSKRSLHLSGLPSKKAPGLSKEEQRRVDEANEAAIMEALMAQIGNNGVDHDEEDDDYYEDDEDYLSEHTKSNESTVTEQAGSVEEDKTERDSNSNNQLEGRSPDYAYDEGEPDDDYSMTDFKPRFSVGDFENASVNELIMLAMRHKARKQSEQSSKFKFASR
ncbi:uncharacterized protein LOC134223978 [Armigeres subalbatus]|uniref:uncharacterized protein LOC134223978 n=1 Tax=Armigeres subalbatus TaxID=124917 RepID=UPI002ED09B6A